MTVKTKDNESRVAYVLIEDGVVVQKQYTKRAGFIKVDDSVACGMLYDGNVFSIPDNSQASTKLQILSELHELDLKSIRAIRQGDSARIQAIEAEAIELRNKLRRLES